MTDQAINLEITCDKTELLLTNYLNWAENVVVIKRLPNPRKAFEYSRHFSNAAFRVPFE